MSSLPYIIAVDFDGTLCEDRFPNFGVPNYRLITALANLRKDNPDGVKLILWTCRDNNTPERYLDKAVEFCKKHGLEFDAVNENLPEVKEMFGNNDTRKVFADKYLDDKNMSVKDFLPGKGFM